MGFAGARAVTQAQISGAPRINRVLPVHFLDVVAGGLDHLPARGDARLHRKHLRLDVLQRIDPVPARRDPVHRQRGDGIVEIERPRQNGRLQPAPPDRAAKLVGDDTMLQLAHAPPELDQFRPQARIVRLPDVPGHKVIGQPQ